MFEIVMLIGFLCAGLCQLLPEEGGEEEEEGGARRGRTRRPHGRGRTPRESQRAGALPARAGR